MILALFLAIVLGTMVGAVFYGQSRSRGRTMDEWAIGGVPMSVLRPDA